MDKFKAFNNCMAVFHYASWRYSNSIVSLTFNGVTYSVDIQLEHDNYRPEIELEVLKQVIAIGAEIRHLTPFSASYDIIVVIYRYED